MNGKHMSNVKIRICCFSGSVHGSAGPSLCPLRKGFIELPVVMQPVVPWLRVTSLIIRAHFFFFMCMAMHVNMSYYDTMMDHRFWRCGKCNLKINV